MISMTGVPFVVYILYKEATKSHGKETAKVSPQLDLEDVSPPYHGKKKLLKLLKK